MHVWVTGRLVCTEGVSVHSKALHPLLEGGHRPFLWLSRQSQVLIISWWTCTGGSSPLPSSIQYSSLLKSTNSPATAAAVNLLGIGGIDVFSGAIGKAEGVLSGAPGKVDVGAEAAARGC